MPSDDMWEPSGPKRRVWRPAPRDEDGTDDADGGGAGLRGRLTKALRTPPVRGRRVRRTIRHIDPWSVLRISLLFYAAIFLIVCVASAILWSAARASGTLDNVESFITSVGGFGECKPIPGAVTTMTTTTSTTISDTDVDQLNPGAGGTTVPGDEAQITTETTVSSSDVGDEEDCQPGTHLVGEFKFEDGRIFTAFAFGGIVLVLAGTGGTVVLVLLFNLMSDLTGGIEATVVEDDPRPRRPREPGSPPPKRDD